MRTSIPGKILKIRGRNSSNRVFAIKNQFMFVWVYWIIKLLEFDEEYAEEQYLSNRQDKNCTVIKYSILLTNAKLQYAKN